MTSLSEVEGYHLREGRTKEDGIGIVNKGESRHRNWRGEIKRTKSIRYSPKG